MLELSLSLCGSICSPVHPLSVAPHPPPTPPSPKPLAVINPSIVTVTAEHASYSCLFRVEELITTSQRGPYRQQCMWCACDTVKFMQMQPVMNSTVEYCTLWDTMLALFQAYPIFHVETSVCIIPMEGAVYLKGEELWFPCLSPFFFLPRLASSHPRYHLGVYLNRISSRLWDHGTICENDTSSFR